ncbi:MAG TPA: hypothetical protein VEL76_38960, partial [Gemmataceae bacterium]|nr:hypothetical protein [Gemmataceae bacterium]
SLVEHGDSIIRDERVWFWVFPGRDGARYTRYRAPQSVLGAGAIVLADATGPVSEGRRHFFFTLTSAFACALLPLAYALWFRHQGMTPRAALCWSMAGVCCTPSWFYGTSTFDDVLGSAALVLAVCVAFLTRRRCVLPGAMGAGLLLGIAFNCKEPLGIFVPAVLAANHDWERPWRGQLGRAAGVLAGLGLGLVAYRLYDLHKFPPGSTADHAAVLSSYVPFWPNRPDAIPAAFLGLTISPGAGVLWYSPTLALCLYGLARWWPAEKWLCRGVVVGALVFLGFLCCLTFFAGDPTWGPRYLTPVLALLWLFAPAGAAWVRPGVGRVLLRLGFIVQVLALSVDPHRLYIERGLPSAFYHHFSPWLYFDGDVSHLLNRPRELVAIVSSGPPAQVFTPAQAPTFTFPVIDFVGVHREAVLAGMIGTMSAPDGSGNVCAGGIWLVGWQREHGQAAVRKYHVLNSLRPWWLSQWYLPPEERPVDLLATCGLLAGMLLAGLALMLLGTAGPREPGSLNHSYRLSGK